ncbi:MAG: hypothetical protein K2O29_02920 [Ruminococcus sp.]|nr:hypothetical protein [Ruminococcus sp.]MDE6849330.1 hypothetical protein [Ruminococcus sp.]MDE7137399.1 hypothetical protein [Ruminococcus sp.]
MEKYRKNLILRIIALSLVVLLAAVLGIFNIFGANEQVKENFIFGFQCGFIIGLGLVSVILIIRYSKAVKDLKKLEVLFNKENDERIRYIKSKAGMPMLQVTSAIMILCGTVFGYFNTTVFHTLIIASMCQLFIGTTVKTIYLKKV